MAVARCHNRYCNAPIPGKYLQVRGEVFCSEKCKESEGRPGIVVGQEKDTTKDSKVAG